MIKKIALSILLTMACMPAFAGLQFATPFYNTNVLTTPETAVMMHFDTGFNDVAGTVWTLAKEAYTVAAINSTAPKFGKGSLADNTGVEPSAWHLTPSTFAPFAVGTGDYTLEYWLQTTNLYTNAGTSHDLFSVDIGLSGGNYRFYVHTYNSSGAQGWMITGGYNGQSLTTTGVQFVADSWYHIAFVRHNSIVTAYVNGVAVGTDTDDMGTADLSSILSVSMGRPNATGSLCHWKIDELRFSKEAVYQSTFTPATKAFGVQERNQLILKSGVAGSDTLPDASTTVLLHLDGNVNDVAGNPWLNATGGGLYPWQNFDSTDKVFGQSLSATLLQTDTVSRTITTTATSAFTMGTGDFTIEFWLGINVTYLNANGSLPLPFSVPLLFSGGAANFRIAVERYGVAQYRISSEFYNTTSSSTYYKGYAAGYNSLNTVIWHHYCVEKRAGFVYVYIDGVQVASGADNGSITNLASPIKLAAQNTDSAHAMGYRVYLDELRVKKGGFVHGGAFTPASAPYGTTSTGSSGGKLIFGGTQ